MKDYDAQKLDAINAAQKWTDEVYRVLRKKIRVPDGNGGAKDVQFVPERWKFDSVIPILQSCNKLLDMLRYANDLPKNSGSPKVREERYFYACRAKGIARSTMGAINDLQRRAQLPMEHFRHTARLYNAELMPLLVNWVKSEEIIG